MKKIIEIRGLTKHYQKDKKVLRELDFSLEAGTVHGLVGLNGAGKTTFLNCLLGLQPFDSGDIVILDEKPQQLFSQAGRVVTVFDSPCLHLNLTVDQTLSHARSLCVEPKRTEAELEKLLGLTQYKDYRISQLSLGNRRRASIAHALVGNPELMILDEPFNGLDAAGVDDVIALILSLNRTESTTFLLSSHQLSNLEQACSHLSILHGGRIIASDEIEKLLENKKPKLTIRTQKQEEALILIKTRSEVRVLEARNELNDSIIVELGDWEASDLNRFLVENGIAVDELRLDRPSVTSFFRDATQSPVPNMETF
jgi:ABC-2 type transport system ATP-binding protein